MNRQQNVLAAGIPPGTTLGSLQRSARPLAGVEVLAAPPQELNLEPLPRFQPSWPRC